MTNNFNQKEIVVYWNDASLFSPKRKAIAVSPMETRGFIEKEYDDYYLIKNPITINRATQESHPQKQNPTFYLIPKGMIEKIEYQ